MGSRAVPLDPVNQHLSSFWFIIRKWSMGITCSNRKYQIRVYRLHRSKCQLQGAIDSVYVFSSSFCRSLQRGLFPFLWGKFTTGFMVQIYNGPPIRYDHDTCNNHGPSVSQSFIMGIHVVLLFRQHRAPPLLQFSS